MSPRVPGIGVTSSAPEETVVEWHCHLDKPRILAYQTRMVYSSARDQFFEHQISLRD